MSKEDTIQSIGANALDEITEAMDGLSTCYETASSKKDRDFWFKQYGLLEKVKKAITKRLKEGETE